MLFFLAGRVFFLIYHIKPVSSFPVSEILLSFYYGLKLDLAFASYITILPAALIPFLLATKVNAGAIRKSLLYYSIFWITALAFAYTVDAELFSFWGFRLDNTLFRYTGTPGEMIGSTFSSPIYILLPAFFLYAYASYRLYKKFLLAFTFEPIRLYVLPAALFMAALLVITIRGGLQQIPINESVAYYSNHPFLNQAALNPAWTLARSVIEQNGPDLKKYKFFTEAEALKIRNIASQDSAAIESPLTTNRPNIILIAWESLSSKVVNDSVTPHFYAQLKNGIYFSNLYASGDRSDKGLVALLSAYPAQPDYSIMTEPGKSRKLPFITQQLKQAGYSSAYIYGGELEFANMRSYMNYNGFDQIIGKKDFPEETWGAKWGAHDEATYNSLFTRIQNRSNPKQPFFYTLFTLSSHEPYDVPAKSVIKGNSKTNMFLNSHHYADDSFHDFIQKAQQEDWWENTWIIVIGDHGHVLPGKNDYATHDPTEFHIPMLWLGGAIKEPKEITRTYSQINLAPSIAQYLNMNPDAFIFSKPINLKDSSDAKIWYSYNDGFACVYNEKRFLQYDLNNMAISNKKGAVNQKDLTWGQAFLQILMEDFYRK